MSEMSMESLYAMGTGMKQLSVENIKIDSVFDGSSDVLAQEAASAESLLDFVETYRGLSGKLTNDKIKMVKRLNANYGRLNKSLESYCMSMEEEAKADSPVEAPAEEAEKTEAKKSSFGQKVGGFFKTIGRAIANFFKKIWAFLKSIPGKIKSLVQKLFTKVEEKVEKETETETTQTTATKVVSSSSASSSSASSSSASSSSGSTKKFSISKEDKKNVIAVIEKQEKFVNKLNSKVNASGKLLDDIIKKFESVEKSDGKESMGHRSMFVVMLYKIIAKFNAFLTQIFGEVNKSILQALRNTVSSKKAAGGRYNTNIDDDNNPKAQFKKATRQERIAAGEQGEMNSALLKFDFKHVSSGNIEAIESGLNKLLSRCDAIVTKSEQPNIDQKSFANEITASLEDVFKILTNMKLNRLSDFNDAVKAYKAFETAVNSMSNNKDGRIQFMMGKYKDVASGLEKAMKLPSKSDEADFIKVTAPVCEVVFGLKLAR